MTHARVSLGALLLAALITGSCGYRIGLSAPEGFATVGVEVFHNNTPEPDLERSLHGALSREVRDRVPLPLVDPRDSELLIRGRSRFAAELASRSPRMIRMIGLS